MPPISGRLRARRVGYRAESGVDAKAGEAAAEDLTGELKEFFLLEKIGEKEKIFATEDEVANRIQMMSMVYGFPRPP